MCKMIYQNEVGEPIFLTSTCFLVIIGAYNTAVALFMKKEEALKYLEEHKDDYPRPLRILEMCE